MTFDKVTDPDAVRAACKEFDELGQDEFLRKHKFRKARSYAVVVESRQYDPKAVLGAAHGYQFPNEGPLSWRDFNSVQARTQLQRLGFTVVDSIESLPGIGHALKSCLSAQAVWMQRWIDSADYPQALKSGHAITQPRTEAVKGFSDSLAELIPYFDIEPTLGDWDTDFGGGKGISSPTVWIRIFDGTAPSAQNDWYVVYIISEDGKSAALSAGFGVTDLGKKSWMREIKVGREILGLDPSTDAIPAGALGKGPKAVAYQQASAWAKMYDLETLQAMTDEQHLADINEALGNVVRIIEERRTAVSNAESGSNLTIGAPSVVDLLRAYRNVIVEGVAGTGKSHVIGDLIRHFGQDRVQVMVFHPSSSYEDFVEGIRPVAQGFDVRDGEFLAFCRKAAALPDEDFVFVIDEINRANTSKVLGDLLLSIEASKRVSPEAAHEILAATFHDPEVESEWVSLQVERTVGDAGSYRQRFCVPSNVLIFGTMNTTDRSVGNLDLALRRRFVFARREPIGAEELVALVGKPSLNAAIDAWQQLNSNLRNVSADALLGHSYFFQFKQAEESVTDGLDIWRDLLLPQLAEILIAFNAVERLEELLAGVDTGECTLIKVGAGIDAYPMVSPRAAQN